MATRIEETAVGIVAKLPWRNTGMMDYNIAVCPTCRVLIPPKKMLSKGGTHGTDIFEHHHPMSFLHLQQSNVSHNRYYNIVTVPAEVNVNTILEEAGKLWLIGRSTHEVEEFIALNVSGVISGERVESNGLYSQRPQFPT